jgi:dihydrofolate reductase
MPSWKAIAAMAQNRVIGLHNRIPWHLPADFQWFKRTTLGGVLVMGRRTFESIGRPLPGRETFILTRSGFTAPGTRSIPDLTTLHDVLDSDPRQAWICGGAEIYQTLLPHCSDLYLTHVDASPEGDAWFPPFESDFSEEGVVLVETGFTVRHYRNLRPHPPHSTR